MKEYQKNKLKSTLGEVEPFIKTFSSQEEADQYRIERDVKRSDMEKFRMFCRMFRIGKMLSSAKIVK